MGTEQGKKWYRLYCTQCESLRYTFHPTVYFKINTSVKYHIFRNGTKIMSLELKHRINIRFIDSHSIVQSKLSDFPKTFGLKELKKKIFFPHHYNTSENQNYIGPIPSTEYYSCNKMSNEG